MLTRNARTVLDTLLPSNANARVSQGLRDVDFEGFYRDFLRDAPLAMIVGFHIAMATATWVGPLLIGKLPPLSRLSRDDRERALEAIAKSPNDVLRQMTLILKATTSFCFGADPDVRDAVGFPRQFDDPRGAAT